MLCGSGMVSRTIGRCGSVCSTFICAAPIEGDRPMKSWATDNFGNEAARDYLSVLSAKLFATINEIVSDEERLVLDKDGESMFMPSVELLALLCERYDAP